jgi:nicotinamide-nucleotide amidase
LTSSNLPDLQQPIRQASIQLSKRLTQAKLKVAVAESCTGGGISEAITAVAGSSEWFDCGVTAYAYEMKTKLLGVPADMLVQHGAVSEPVVISMVQGVKALANAQCAIAVSGIAGPGGGTPQKPVGTVCFALIARDELKTHTMHFAGSRDAVRAQATLFALRKLDEMLAN